MSEVQLEDFAGRDFMLDAVDFGNTSPNSDAWDRAAEYCRFRLDGEVYVAMQDPNDGYRSCLKEICIQKDPDDITNKFGIAVHVIGVRIEDDGDDLIEFVDAVTGKPVLHIGTCNTDDYYPSFVAHFMPENMVVNKKLPKNTPRSSEAIEVW